LPIATASQAAALEQHSAHLEPQPNQRMSLDSNTGALTNIAGSPFPAGANPLSAAIDPSSKFVFVANEADNTLSACSMDSSGGLTAITGSPFTVGSQPQGVTVDLSGKFVYVASADGNVCGFSLNTGTASLTPIAGSPFHANATLRDIVVLKQ
jgi:6-phosphogluconolactonase